MGRVPSRPIQSWDGAGGCNSPATERWNMPLLFPACASARRRCTAAALIAGVLLAACTSGARSETDAEMDRQAAGPLETRKSGPDERTSAPAPTSLRPSLRDTLELVRSIRRELPPGFQLESGSAYVILDIRIDETGAVRSATVQHSSGIPDLDQAFLKGIRSARFTPARRGEGENDGRGVPTRFSYPLGWPELHDPPIRFEYSCDRWTPYPPREKRVVADLHLRTEENRKPGADALRAIRGAGGRVLHTFHAPLIRAELDTAAVRELVSGPAAIANRAVLVRDTTRREVELRLIFTRPVRGSDLSVIEQLGGVVLGSGGGRRPGVTVQAPDSVIPYLRRLPGLDRLRLPAIGCARLL